MKHTDTRGDIIGNSLLSDCCELHKTCEPSVVVLCSNWWDGGLSPEDSNNACHLVSLDTNCINLMAGHRATIAVGGQASANNEGGLQLQEGKRGCCPIYEIVTQTREGWGRKKWSGMRGNHRPKQFPYYANTVYPTKRPEITDPWQRGYWLHF